MEVEMKNRTRDDLLLTIRVCLQFLEKEKERRKVEKESQEGKLRGKVKEEI